MRELASSLIGFTWAGSLLAVQGAEDLVAALRPGRGTAEGQARFERLSWEVSRRLHGAPLELFQVGDSLQRDTADLLLPHSPWDAAEWLRRAAELGTLAGPTLRFCAPTAGGLDAWRELADKLEVYRLVKEVATTLDLPARGEPFGLRALVERAYELDEFAALWAVEGLGHDYALHSWPPGGPAPRGLLTGTAAAGLPARSLTMLHAGVGLAFAQRLLGELPPGEPPKRTRETVSAILDLCRASSRAGYEGAAIESLGLVTRTYHGERTSEIDGLLRDLGEDVARELFWHGVGRALYFLPINFLPAGDTTWRPFRMVCSEAPDPVARRNAIAGLGWAFILVNMRLPELTTRLLLAPHGASLEAKVGFANGVASSIVMRTDTTPESLLVETFLGHRPRLAAEAWNDLVVAPSRRALEDVYPRLRRQEALGEIFRFRAEIGRGDAGGRS